MVYNEINYRRRKVQKMPKRNYYYNSYRDKPSPVAVTLNVIIIVLLVIVLSLLGLYAYTFFSGNDPLARFGITLPWSAEIAENTTEPTVIVPSESTITEMTVTTTTVTSETVNIVVSDTDETTASTAETEPKYTSTEYDKEFYNNTLFIGDSIFTGFSGFGYLLPENVFAQVGLNPESALTKQIDGVTAAEKALAMQPERICIMLGTNGLAFLSSDYMVSEMSKLVDSLKENCPDTQIVILSIPPVTEEHEKENPEKIAVISDYNSKLEALAEEKECTYIDIFTMLQDENGYLAEEYAEVDGLHFLGKAYGVVLSRIQHDLTTPEEDENVDVQPVQADTAAETQAETTETTAETSTVTVIVPDGGTAAETSAESSVQ